MREEAVAVVSGHKEMGWPVGGVSKIVNEEDVVERNPADHLEPGAFAFGYFAVEVTP